MTPPTPAAAGMEDANARALAVVRALPGVVVLVFDLRAVLGGAGRVVKLAPDGEPGTEWTVEVAPLRTPGADAVIGGILVLGQVTHDLFQTRFPVSKEAVDAELARTGWWEGRLLHRRADGTIRMVDSRQALRRDELDRPRAARIAEAIERLDHMITELRRHIFALDPDQVGLSAGPER